MKKSWIIVAIVIVLIGVAVRSMTCQTPETKKHSNHVGRCACTSKCSSLPGIRNLHRPDVLALASVEHFERVLVRAEHAEHLFHGNVLQSGRGAICLAFQRDDFVAILAFPLACKHRGLDVTHPYAVELLLRVVVAYQAPPGKRLAHHFAVE